MNYFGGLLLTVMLATPTAAYAWGATGHAIIAELAERRITSSGTSPVPATTLSDLLGSGISLASFASWADDFALTPAGKKTRAWHRIPIDLGATEKNWKGDCKDEGEGDCLPVALAREINVLADKTAGRQARILALKFVVNLVGELTDPLNCVARNEDKGDAALKVDFTGEDAAGSPLLARDGTPLHQLVSLRELWDSTLIDNHTPSFGSYVDELEIAVPALSTFTIADPTKTIDNIKPWVDDCHKLGVLTYVQLPGGTASPMPLTAKYQRFAQPIVEQQLALAASQLASVLNYALSK
jgi:hypothetical protein